MGVKRVSLLDARGKCSFCRVLGHDAQNCEHLNKRIKIGDVYAKKFYNSINGGGRVCGYCAEKDHSTATCPQRFSELRTDLIYQKSNADPAFAWLQEIGFGPGAMLSGMTRTGYWRTRKKEEKIVIISEFKQSVATSFFNELLYGNEKNWYTVNAIDTTNEDVHKIYLPFHPVYAPRPASKNVQIIHRSNDEDIEKLKSFLSCYTNPVIKYATAADFFNAGYKFKTGNSKKPEIDYTFRNIKKNQTAC